MRQPIDSRLLCVSSKIWPISPHEGNVWHKDALNARIALEVLFEKVVAWLVTRGELQVLVFPKCCFGRVDALWVRHINALREGAHGNISEPLDHLHARRLVLPVKVIEVATAGHDDGRVRFVCFEHRAEVVDVAISVNEAVDS